MTDGKIQPARSYNQKRRLAAALRGRGHTEENIRTTVWQPSLAPTKHLKYLPLPTSAHTKRVFKYPAKYFGSIQ